MGNISKFLNNRKVRYGSYAIVITLVVIALVIGINAFVSSDKIRNKIKVDMTSTNIYSIGDETKKLLDELNKEVVIYGLFDENQVRDPKYIEVVEFIGKYEALSQSIKIEYVDPVKKPGFIEQVLNPDGVLEMNAMDYVVVCGEKKKVLSVADLFKFQYNQDSGSYYKVGSNAESAFSGAITYVTAEITPIVYFTEGHGEPSIDEQFTTIKKFLEGNNYDVKKINIATEDSIPDDAEILIMGSPKMDISIDEKSKIEDFFANGGHGVFLIDPNVEDPSFDNLNELLTEYNIQFNYDLVSENDATMHIKNDKTTILPKIESNEINSSNSIDKSVTMFSQSRSINVLKNDKDYIQVIPLLTTSDEAIGTLISPDRGEDNKGPLNLAVMVDYRGGFEPVKILAMGNAYFATDEGYQYYDVYAPYNMQFLFNAIYNMQDKRDDIYIPAKQYTQTSLNIDAMSAILIAIAVGLVLPIIIIGAGMYVWLRRRHL